MAEKTPPAQVAEGPVRFCALVQAAIGCNYYKVTSSINVQCILYRSVGIYTQRMLPSNLAVECLINYSIF